MIIADYKLVTAALKLVNCVCVFILTADENETGHQFTWISTQRIFKCLHVLVCVKKKKLRHCLDSCVKTFNVFLSVGVCFVFFLFFK